MNARRQREVNTATPLVSTRGWLRTEIRCAVLIERLHYVQSNEFANDVNDLLARDRVPARNLAVSRANFRPAARALPLSMNWGSRSRGAEFLAVAA